MKRAAIVITSTAAGMGLLLSYHTSHGSLSVKSATGTVPEGTGSPSTSAPQPTSGSPAGTASPTTTAPAASSTRNATGSDVQYRYGDIELAVTATGSKIDNITVVKNDATDGRSYQINSEAVPILESETLSAQSSQIDGVSGASYTSQAYVQSLQSALDQLGIQ